MDLVDEEHVALVERGEDRREVAGALHRGSARVADVHLELAGDDRGEGGLAEAGRAEQQDVVGCLPSLPRRLEQDREVVLDVDLADVLAEAARPERPLDHAVHVVEHVGREDVRDVVGHLVQSTTIRCPYRTDVLCRRGRRMVGQQRLVVLRDQEPGEESREHRHRDAKGNRQRERLLDERPRWRRRSDSRRS